MSFVVSTLSFSIPGAPPAPTTCTTTDAAVMQSDGSWFSNIAIDWVKEIKGSSRTWVNGYAEEFLLGTKRAVVYGSYMETYWSTKHQQIVINETKFNIALMEESCLGFKTEVVKGWTLEFEKAGKLHVASGQKVGVIASGNKVKAALEKQQYARLRKTITNYEQRVASIVSEKVRDYKRSVGTMKMHTGNLKERAGEFELHQKNASTKCDSHDLKTDGDESRTTGAAMNYIGSGASRAEGSGSVSLTGSGTNVVLNGKMAVDGTDLVVEK